MKQAIAICTLAALTFGVSGCAVSADHANRQNEYIRQQKEINDNLKDELHQKEVYISELEAANVKWQDYSKQVEEALELAKQQPKEVVTKSVLDEDLLNELGQGLSNDFRSTLSDGEFKVIEASHAVGVRMDDGSDVLFLPGSWTLTGNAKKSVDKLADAVKATLGKNPNYVVRIDGHTDSDPVRRAKKLGIENNVHLGFMRAFTVYKALQAKGVPASKMTVLTAGEHMEVSASKKFNRRVEVWVSTPEGFSYSSGKPTGSVSR